MAGREVICPICCGRGRIDVRVGEWSESRAPLFLPVECRRCEGKGRITKRVGKHDLPTHT